MIDINEIGYFKYKSNIETIVDCIKEFPITDDIKTLIKHENNISIEIVDGEPNLIEGKYVVLI